MSTNTEKELVTARALIKSLKTGVGIVDKTFYQPNNGAFTAEATERVVKTMIWSIGAYEQGFGDLP